MKYQNSDEFFISRTLTLAKKGAGFVSPNPLVGALVVKNGMIVGYGYHEKAGEPHAEINALQKAGKQAIEATLYVNLEPCSHFGKTPPCVEAIKKYGIKRVVAGILDPNSLVSGKGFKYLKANGIEVKYGVLESEAKKLNEVFLKYITKKEPFVTIKIAVSLDGKIGYEKSFKNKEKFYLSSEESLEYVHYLRFINDGVMVSAKTVINDDPLLNIRYGKYGNRKKLHTKIILDPNLATPPDSKLFETGGKILIFTSEDFDSLKKKKGELLEQKGAIIQKVYYNKLYNKLHNGLYLDLKQVFKICAEMGITSILVETGRGLFGYLALNGLCDKLIVNVTPKILGADGTIDIFDGVRLITGGSAEPVIKKDAPFSGSPKKKGYIAFTGLSVKKAGDDVFLTYYPGNIYTIPKIT